MMSVASTDRRRNELEDQARGVERQVDTESSTNDRLQAAIAAAELYIQALSLTDDPSEKKRLNVKAKILITHAEKLKAAVDGGNEVVAPLAAELAAARAARPLPISTRQPTPREQIIVLEGSKLSNAIFKPWMRDPSQSEFDLNSRRQLFEDDTQFSLSDMMLKHFAGWERPSQALSRIKINSGSSIAANEPSMDNPPTLPYDLVQDVTPNCSVVASLCVGTARASHGHRKLLASVIHPYDQDSGHPDLSRNGKYVMKLNFNGSARAVEIDDRLPASKTDRILHIIDRSHPGLLWPALVEKAYLKIRGGYDFPGSNSGTDLHVIIGWIPQQIALHHEEVQPGALWAELFGAWSEGDVLITLGTGKISRQEMKHEGLAAEHDYAVLELRKNERGGELLIKNPWKDGEVWKGAARRKPNPGHETTPDDAVTEHMMPGTFWMDWQLMFQHFAHMYVNWNPARFEAREDIHFTWHQETISRAGFLVFSHPQFSVQVNTSGEVWVLLNRHFRTGDFTSHNHGKNGYISLYLFDNDGVRICTTEAATIRGPFVDSPNTLLRFRARAKQQYTIVAMSQDLPIGRHNFTLSTFACSSIMLSEARHKYQAPQVLRAAWTYNTAGGSSDNLTYFQNPQFSLSIPQVMNIAIILKVTPDPVDVAINAPDSNTMHDDEKYHVKLLITPSPVSKPLITRLLPRDALAHSGEYRRKECVIECHLAAGHYTVIASTFDPGVRSSFKLELHTAISVPKALIPTLKSIPSERAGRFSTLATPAVFDTQSGMTKLVAPLTMQRIGKAIFLAQSSAGTKSMSQYRLTLQQGVGPYSTTLASSGHLSDLSRGIRIDDMVLTAEMRDPSRGGIWLALESDGLGAIGREVVQVEILSEDKVGLGQWRVIGE